MFGFAHAPYGQRSTTSVALAYACLYLHILASKVLSARETASRTRFNMRLSYLSALCSVFTVAFSHPEATQQSQRGTCPYASTRTEKSGCIYSNAKRSSAIDSTVSSEAQGKQGVFFMNRIAPGTSELYIANADGSDERKQLSNSSNFDYHATFSPDGQWITFTTERNGDGNSVSAYKNSIKYRMANPVCRTYIAFDPTDLTWR